MRIMTRSIVWAIVAQVVVGAGAAGAAEAPAWVGRGSTAVNNRGERAFYGVGSASGIKNPPLLRSTADNRARSEIAKVFETFSASLMKDYMSSEGQQIEQAVKSFAAMSLEGVEIRDRYIAGDGTLYALAVLDLDKVAPAVRKAKEQGIVKSDVQPVTLDDIFDRHARKEAPQKPVVASGGEAGDQKAPKEARGETRQQRGDRPDWIDGEGKRFPFRQYLCAVGYGPQRDIAENGAYAAIAKIFVVHVESASKDFMSAYSQTGAPSLEVQSSATLTKTTTQKLLSGVRIPEVWQDKDATVYALSCLDREKNGKLLREQIDELDKKAGAALGRAEAADAQTRLKDLARALDTLLVREALNNELRIVDFDGIGAASAYALYDVAAALEAAQEQLRVGVTADGPYADDFRNALVEALTAKGYKVEATDGGDPAGFDVLVSAKVRLEDGAGAGSAAALHFARGVVLLEVKNVRQGKVIGSFNENRKEGHRSKEEAERRVVRELGKKLAAKVGAKLDDAMKGRRG